MLEGFISRAVLILQLSATYGVVSSIAVHAEALPNFNCALNGNISLKNPHPETMIWVNATNSVDADCSAKFLVDPPQNAVDRQLVGITGCSLETDISVILSTEEGRVPDVVTEASVVFYTIRCLVTPTEGFTRDFVEKSWVTNVINTQKQEPVTVKLQLSAQIEKPTEQPWEDTGTPGTGSTIPTTTTALSAKLFEKLTWVAQGPAGYRILPQNCSVYSGVLADGSQHQLPLIMNGCSLNKDIVSDFWLPNASEPHRAVADFWTFRFPGSPEIILVCRIRGCTLASNSCDWTCPERKRRSLDDIIRMIQSKSTRLVTFRDSGRNIQDVRVGAPDVTVRKRDVSNAIATSDNGYVGDIRISIFVYDDEAGIEFGVRSAAAPNTWLPSTPTATIVLLTLAFS